MRRSKWQSLVGFAALTCVLGGSQVLGAQAAGESREPPAVGAQQAPAAGAPNATAPREAATEDGAIETAGDLATQRDGEPFDVEKAVEGYLARMAPEEKERSDAYMEGGYWLQLWGFLWGVGVALLLLFGGLSARMRDLAERLTSKTWLQPAVFGVQYVVAVALLTFPLTLYQGFFREHRYDLSNQTFLQWLRDQGVGLLVGAVLTSLFLLVLYLVFRRAPRTWWLWGAGVTVAAFAVIALIAPVYIAPLFNTYTPLEDPQIRDPILSLARANGVPANKVWEFDASRQSKRISANVSGFAGTMRISLNDNLLERGTREEIEAVMAHELGHYVLHHVYKGMLFITLVALVGFGFVRLAFGRLVATYGERWRVRGLADPAGFPLVVLLFSIFGFVLTPVVNNYVRTAEAEADLFAINASREPDAFASVAVKLGEYRKLDPGPWEEWLFYDHPSGRSRIEMAMRWKAENQASLGDSR
jgi:STE24 endopeptidase